MNVVVNRRLLLPDQDLGNETGMRRDMVDGDCCGLELDKWVRAGRLMRLWSKAGKAMMVE